MRDTLLWKETQVWIRRTTSQMINWQQTKPIERETNENITDEK
jgi:hypothetical protein